MLIFFFFGGGVQDFRKQCSNFRLVKSRELFFLCCPYLLNPDTKLEGPSFLDHGSHYSKHIEAPLFQRFFNCKTPYLVEMTQFDPIWLKQKIYMGWNHQLVKHHFACIYIYIESSRLRQQRVRSCWSLKHIPNNRQDDDFDASAGACAPEKIVKGSWPPKDNFGILRESTTMSLIQVARSLWTWPLLPYMFILASSF